MVKNQHIYSRGNKLLKYYLLLIEYIKLLICNELCHTFLYKHEKTIVI